MAFLAKNAVGTNLSFVKGFSRILRSWREIFQRKTIPNKPVANRPDLSHSEAKEKCLLQVQPVTINRLSSSLRSNIFRSVTARTNMRSVAARLRRQTAWQLSGAGRNFRSMPIMSLVGISVGVNLTSVMDDGSERMMLELQKSFRSFQWQAEPIEKIPTCLEDLEILKKTIANGCEGAVYKAKFKTDECERTERSVYSGEEDEEYDLAVKAVFNYGAESNAHSILRELQREVVPLWPENVHVENELGQRVNCLPPHPNVVDMPGIFVDDVLVTEEGMKNFPAAMPNRLDQSRFYGRNKTLYLVMRRRSGHLKDFLSSNHTVSMETRCQILAQVLEGVAHLAQHGVVHRDLKADNILVDVPKDGGCPHVELCDFGCCLAEENKSMRIAYPSKDMYLGGNWCHTAPEISTAVPGPNSVLDFSKSDLWAVGAISYEILGADNPFYPNQDNSRQLLYSRNYWEEDLPPLPDDVPLPVKKLVKKLLSRDPTKRPTASVAAAVVQMVGMKPKFESQSESALSTLNLNTKVCRYEGLNQRGTRYTSIKGAGKKQRSNPYRRQSDLVSECPSFVLAVARDRKWLNEVISHGMTLLCKLMLGDRSEPWDVESVMAFTFLSRLTYADFRQAMSYFES